jgi:predicted transcriptional regulator
MKVELAVSGISTLLKRLVPRGVIDFQVAGARHFTSAHEMKQALLASSYSCTCHILATNVALMVWSNHDENI